MINTITRQPRDVGIVENCQYTWSLRIVLSVLVFTTIIHKYCLSCTWLYQRESIVSSIQLHKSMSFKLVINVSYNGILQT